MFQLLLLFIFAHFMADFVLQTNSVIKLKKEQLHKGLRLHLLTHLLVMSITSLTYFLFIDNMITIAMVTAVIFLILVIHYLVDWAKEIIKRKHDNVFFSAFLFLGDQLIHVLSIIVLFNWLGLTNYSLVELMEISLSFLFEGVVVNDFSKLIMIGIILILVTEGAGYLLGILLRDLGPNPTLNKNMYSITDEKTEIKTFFNEKGEEVNEVTTIRTDQFYNDSPKQIGRYIGMIERVLIMIFIVQGIPHGMTFLIAVKSLTRFKQFESKAFSEYYLIGSLLSAAIGILFGYAVLRVL